MVTKKVARVVPDAVQRFFADQCPQHAAGIAYRVLFSIAPLAIVLVSIFGLVLQDDSVRHDVVNTIVDALPVSAAGRKDVEDAITGIATPASAAGLIGLLVFGWAATGMMTAIRRGLESAMGVAESRPLARGKLVDLGLIVGAAVLVLVTVGLNLLGNLLQRASGSLSEALGLGSSTLAGVLLHGARFVLSIVVVLLLYRFVPARGLRIRDGLAGAIATALLFLLISLASGWISREDGKAQRGLRLAHDVARLPLLRLSLLLCAAPRRRDSRRVVAAADRGWRTDPHPSETGRAGALRQSEGVAGRRADARRNS